LLQLHSFAGPHHPHPGTKDVFLRLWR